MEATGEPSTQRSGKRPQSATMIPQFRRSKPGTPTRNRIDSLSFEDKLETSGIHTLTPPATSRPHLPESKIPSPKPTSKQVEQRESQLSLSGSPGQKTRKSETSSGIRRSLNAPLVAFGSRVEHTTSRSRSSSIKRSESVHTIFPSGSSVNGSTSAIGGRPRAPVKDHCCPHSHPASHPLHVAGRQRQARSMRDTAVQTDIQITEEPSVPEGGDTKKRKLPNQVDMNKFADPDDLSDDDWANAFDDGGHLLETKIALEPPTGTLSARPRRASSSTAVKLDAHLLKYVEPMMNAEASLDFDDDGFADLQESSDASFTLKQSTHDADFDEDAWPEVEISSDDKDSGLNTEEEKSFKFHGQEFELDEDTKQGIVDAAYAHDTEFADWSHYFDQCRETRETKSTISECSLVLDDAFFYDVRGWSIDFMVHQALKANPITPEHPTAIVPSLFTAQVKEDNVPSSLEDLDDLDDLDDI
eukprot:TRINITY_DN7658_c0_g1::TRINITY_DN7658_c0_g1_i1::g.18652::m.18652 TRINITY_DN7658_c0_g1::TRINITY_DN7658_c0_g1_i1::g.18652  ORF type:complete len:472 (-),score=56.52 TRINITY_DN7658_c0_g1_i1:430-1845(-)